MIKGIEGEQRRVRHRTRDRGVGVVVGYPAGGLAVVRWPELGKEQGLSWSFCLLEDLVSADEPPPLGEGVT